MKQEDKEKEIYIDAATLQKTIGNREIVIFGAGEDGRAFEAKYHNIFKIKCFVDSNVSENELRKTSAGTEVKNVKKLYEVRTKCLILIVSSRYYKEMKEQLENMKFISGVDFFVWTDVNLKMIKRFVEHNKAIWKKDVKIKRNNQVLVLHSKQNGIFPIWSYYSNFFADRYCAELYGFGTQADYKVDELDIAVYASFNVDKWILYNFSKEQYDEIENAYQSSMGCIESKKRLLNIEIRGYKVGFYIYSIYLRYISPVWEGKRYKNEICSIVRRAICSVVFWDTYFREHSVKCIILGDALNDQAIIREVAVCFGIAVYSIETARCKRCYSGYYAGTTYGVNYKKEFQKLPEEKQDFGICWAKDKLEKRLMGDVSDIPYMEKSAFGMKYNRRVLRESNKVKVVICPHCLSDDPFSMGKFLFNDHVEWLEFLGEMSKRTDYDWYFKVHPSAEKKSMSIYNMILEKYPQITLLPIDVSAVQLRDEGLDVALTLWGTLGHEYAALGINVINGGRNFHEDFSFNYNPRTIEEYTNLLLNLNKLEKKIDMQEVYQFYCMHYLLKMPVSMRFGSVFYPKSNLYAADCNVQLIWKYNKYGMPFGDSCMYDGRELDEFLNNCTPEHHMEILEEVKKYVQEADELYEHQMREGKES